MPQILQLFTKAFQNVSVVTIVSVAVGIIIAFVAIYLDWRSEQRSRDTFSIERRRITEVNLKVNHQVHIAPSQQMTADKDMSDHAFMILRLLLENSGDGPIDILGMLVASRLLTGSNVRGIGNHGRDVEWEDYETSYWDKQDSKEDKELFSGISTTKHIVSTTSDFFRLAAKEIGSLRRIDSVNNVDKMYKQQHATVMYRVFSVARGYPLGEILRQLGGGPPDPANNVNLAHLQFEAIAQPDYFRWRILQQALINLNHIAFRLALYKDHPEDSRDPLGILSDPNAWRIFLMHHWEFVDETVAAPEGFIRKTRLPNFMELINAATKEVQTAIYPDLVLPENWNTDDPQFKQAIDICHGKLGQMVALWNHMKKTITVCSDYQTTPQKGEKYVDIGYAALIHHAGYFKQRLGKDLDYEQRWLALLREGYLVSKPFYARRKIGKIPIFLLRHKTYSTRDIPRDPRALEPYVIRVHYFLDSVAFPKKDEKNWKTVEL